MLLLLISGRNCFSPAQSISEVSNLAFSIGSSSDIRTWDAFRFLSVDSEMGSKYPIIEAIDSTLDPEISSRLPTILITGSGDLRSANILLAIGWAAKWGGDWVAGLRCRLLLAPLGLVEGEEGTSDFPQAGLSGPFFRTPGARVIRRLFGRFLIAASLKLSSGSADEESVWVAASEGGDLDFGMQVANRLVDISSALGLRLTVPKALPRNENHKSGFEFWAAENSERPNQLEPPASQASNRAVSLAIHINSTHFDPPLRPESALNSRAGDSTAFFGFLLAAISQLAELAGPRLELSSASWLGEDTLKIEVSVRGCLSVRRLAVVDGTPAKQTKSPALDPLARRHIATLTINAKSPISALSVEANCAEPAGQRGTSHILRSRIDAAYFARNGEFSFRSTRTISATFLDFRTEFPIGIAPPLRRQLLYNNGSGESEGSSWLGVDLAGRIAGCFFRDELGLETQVMLRLFEAFRLDVYSRAPIAGRLSAALMSTDFELVQAAPGVLFATHTTVVAPSSLPFHLAEGLILGQSIQIFEDGRFRGSCTLELRSGLVEGFGLQQKPECLNGCFKGGFEAALLISILTVFLLVLVTLWMKKSTSVI